jgi:methyl-accepting chemotaxis protein
MAGHKRLSFVDDINRRVTLVAALVAIVLVGLNYLFSVRDARAQVDDRADEVIAAITEAFRLPFWDHNLSNAMEIATAFSANDWVVYVRVRDASDRPIAGVGIRDDASIFRDADIRYGDRLIGHVAVGLTLHPLDKQVRHAVLNSVIMLLAVVVALYVFNRTFLRRALQRPARLLLDRIHGIAHERYQLPAQDIRHDEIREVVQQFDAMAQKVEQRERSYVEANLQLQATQAALSQHRDQLEQTVAERTGELKDEIRVRRHTEEQLLHAKQAAETASSWRR